MFESGIFSSNHFLEHGWTLLHERLSILIKLNNLPFIKPNHYFTIHCFHGSENTINLIKEIRYHLTVVLAEKFTHKQIYRPLTIVKLQNNPNIKYPYEML